MTTGSDKRNTEYNHGIVLDRDMPDDKYIAGAVVILMDDAGEFTAHFVHQRTMFHWRTAPLPSPEVREDLGSLLATAWNIASLTTTEES